MSSAAPSLAATIGSPAATAVRTASTTRLCITSRPRGNPFDVHGVLQHSASMSSGTVAAIPARVSNAVNAAVARMILPNMYTSIATSTPR